MTALFVLFAILIAWFGAWGYGLQWERPEITEEITSDKDGIVH